MNANFSKLYFSKSTIWKLIAFTMFIFPFEQVNSQAYTFYQENFEGFTTNSFLFNTPSGGWQSEQENICGINNNAGNYWSISNQGSKISGRSLMIAGSTSSGGVCYPIYGSYYSNVESNQIAYTTIDAEGFQNIILDFDYKSAGEFTAPAGPFLDYGKVVYRVGISGPWIELTTGGYNNLGYFNGRSSTTHQTLNLPAALNNSDFQLGFKWVSNNNSGGTIPPFTVDNIKIKGNSIVPCSTFWGAYSSKESVCQGEQFELYAAVYPETETYTCDWYTDWNPILNTGTYIGTGSTLPITPTKTETYHVIVTRPGCYFSSSITIPVTPVPNALILHPDGSQICENDVVQLYAEGGEVTVSALSENFNSSSGFNWIISGSVSGGDLNKALWSFAELNDEEFFDWRSNDNSRFAIVSSELFGNDWYNWGTYTMQSSLTSSTFSLVDLESPINLNFHHHYRHVPNSEQIARIEISTNGGTTWSTLKTLNATEGTKTSFVLKSINLDAYAGLSNLKIKFHYEGRFEYYWGIDNVNIEGQSKRPITWTPTTGLYHDPDGFDPYTGGHADTIYARPTSSTTYTASSSLLPSCPTSSTLTVLRGEKFWNGANPDWSIDTNWIPQGIPDFSHCVKIPSSTILPEVPPNFHGEARNLEIASGGGLTIQGLGSLTVLDFIKNFGDAEDFTIKSDGNLVQFNWGSENTGEIKAERYVSNMDNDLVNQMDYVYWSSPVAGQELKAFSPGTPNNRFFVYNESNDYFYPTNPLNNFAPAKGYALRAETKGTVPGYEDVNFYNKTYSFSGEPNNGNIPIEIHKSAPTGNIDHGYNLVGNPYPSDIHADLLFEINPGMIYKSVFFWTNSTYTANQHGSNYAGSNYAVYNQTGGNPPTEENSPYNPNDPYSGNLIPDGTIKVGQGFMVHKKDLGSGNLEFQNYIRMVGFGPFYHKTAKDRFWVSMISPNGLKNTMLVGYIPGATNDFEIDFDASFLGGSDGLYSLLDEDKLSIQGKAPEFDTDDVIPLGTKHFAYGRYSFELRDTEGIFDEKPIFIKDKLLRRHHKLSDGPYYFEAAEGETLDRFEIVFKYNQLTTDSNNINLISITKENHQIQVKSNIQKIKEVEIFNLMGKSVYKNSNVNAFSESISESKFQNQIIVVTVVTELGESTSKMFVNK